VDYRPSGKDTCVGNVAKLYAYEDAQGQFNLEIRHQAEVEFPKDFSGGIPGLGDDGLSDVPNIGVCRAGDARKACADASCEIFEVITGVPTKVDHSGIHNLGGYGDSPQELN
jgi:hypothetical protein